MGETCLLEYVWIDGKQNLRSKTRVYDKIPENVKEIPDWNYDGSSTYQATTENSEIILKPCAMFDYFENWNSVKQMPVPPKKKENGPLKRPPVPSHKYAPPKKNTKTISLHKLVLCDTYYTNGTHTETNNRYEANKIFNKLLDEEPWFGLEQEYFMIDPQTMKPLGFPDNEIALQGQYYCSVGANNSFGRSIAEEHLKVCIASGIKISGINAEVAPGQWEFQIGPCTGIEQGDHLWMARYLLQKIAEKYNVIIDFSPKPVSGDWNGSGCHTNYSTKNMREGTKNKNGIFFIEKAIKELSQKHDEHMKVYGEGNELRMTGKCETASYDIFSDGISNRGASIRRGFGTIEKECGYFEDRRPSSNCDPYLVTSKIFETTMKLSP